LQQRGVFEAMPLHALAYFVARHEPRSTLVACASDQDAERFAAALSALGTPDVVTVASGGHTPFELVSPDPAIAAGRFALRARLTRGDLPQVIVVSAPALLYRWMPQEVFSQNTRTYQVG